MLAEGRKQPPPQQSAATNPRWRRDRSFFGFNQCFLQSEATSRRLTKRGARRTMTFLRQQLDARVQSLPGGLLHRRNPNRSTLQGRGILSQTGNQIRQAQSNSLQLAEEHPATAVPAPPSHHHDEREWRCQCRCQIPNNPLTRRRSRCDQTHRFLFLARGQALFPLAPSWRAPETPVRLRVKAPSVQYRAEDQ